MFEQEINGVIWCNGKILNPVFTDDEYAEQGFLPHEIPLIRRHDMLYNQWVHYGYLKPRKTAEMMYIIKRLFL